MPRYFFNVHDGANIIDDVGIELANLAAAQGEAVRYSGSLLRDMGEKFWSGEEWHMDVTDESGLILFTLTFLATRAAAMPSKR